MATWTIWTVKPWCGDRHDCIAMYHNRGHALAALRGFRRRAWAAASEITYVLQRG